LGLHSPPQALSTFRIVNGAGGAGRRDQASHSGAASQPAVRGRRLITPIPPLLAAISRVRRQLCPPRASASRPARWLPAPCHGSPDHGGRPWAGLAGGGGSSGGAGRPDAGPGAVRASRGPPGCPPKAGGADGSGQPPGAVRL